MARKRHSHKKLKYPGLGVSWTWSISDRYLIGGSLIPRHIRRKTTQAIRVICIGMEYFLTQRLYSGRSRKIRRRLLLWRLGVIQGEAIIKYITCRDNEEVSREHIVGRATSRLELPKTLSASGTSPLDDILRGCYDKEGQADKNCKELTEHMTLKCLGHSSGCRLSTRDNNQGVTQGYR